MKTLFKGAVGTFVVIVCCSAADFCKNNPSQNTGECMNQDPGGASVECVTGLEVPHNSDCFGDGWNN